MCNNSILSNTKLPKTFRAPVWIVNNVLRPSVPLSSRRSRRFDTHPPCPQDMTSSLVLECCIQISEHTRVSRAEKETLYYIIYGYSCHTAKLKVQKGIMKSTWKMHALHFFPTKLIHYD